MNIKKIPRGFRYMDSFKTSYGHTLQIQESSSYDPSIWLRVDGAGNTCDDPESRLSVHLTLKQAEKLRNQLDYFINNHYSQEDG